MNNDSSIVKADEIVKKSGADLIEFSIMTDVKNLVEMIDYLMVDNNYPSLMNYAIDDECAKITNAIKGFLTNYAVKIIEYMEEKYGSKS